MKKLNPCEVQQVERLVFDLDEKNVLGRDSMENEYVRESN